MLNLTARHRTSPRGSFVNAHQSSPTEPLTPAPCPQAAAHPDGHAVPGVDGGQGPDDFDNFLAGELGFERVKGGVVMAVLVGQARQRFGSGRRGALPLAVKADFTPGRLAVDSLLGFAQIAQVPGVQVQS